MTFWGVEPFENDEAVTILDDLSTGVLDLSDIIEDATAYKVINETAGIGLVVAGALLIGMRPESNYEVSFTELVDSWDEAEIKEVKRLLKKVLHPTKSELAQTWADSEDYPQWQDKINWIILNL